jgi:hypothetical protein
MNANKEQVQLLQVQLLEVQKLRRQYAQLLESSDETTLQEEDSGFLENSAPDNDSLDRDSPGPVNNSRIYLDLDRWRSELEKSATSFSEQREKI